MNPIAQIRPCCLSEASRSGWPLNRVARSVAARSALRGGAK